MKNILIDVSGKIDSSYVQAIREIKKITDSQNISFFIIGALARDIIMEYFYGIKAPRITMDIDLGIKVSGWDKFDRLINVLEESGKFRRVNYPRLKSGASYNYFPSSSFSCPVSSLY